MNNREKRDQIPAYDALKEWLSKDMSDGPLEFSLIPQAAPNRHINVYRVVTSEGVLFVKVYLDTPDVAEREIEYYQYFKDLPFVSKLKHHIFPANSEKRLIAYEFIEGEDLHRQFTAARQNGRYLPDSVMLQAIDQMSQMRDTAHNYDSILPAKTPWPLKTPIRREFIRKGTEEQFLTDYEWVFTQNTQILELFPGYYFDRNPRNLMHDTDGVRQVDFGVIERSSPIFDLVKLLRNGTDIALTGEVDLSTITGDSPEIEQISTYPLSAEAPFLRHAYDDYAGKNQLNKGASFETFVLSYQFAAIHSHFFYMTKYLRMLKEDTGERNKLISRCAYHIGLARKTIGDLTLLAYPVAHLEKWIDVFVAEVKPDSQLR